MSANQIAQRVLDADRMLPHNLADWPSDMLAGRRKQPSKGNKKIARDMIFCPKRPVLYNIVEHAPIDRTRLKGIALG